MKWPFVVRVLLVVVPLALAGGACQVTPEFVQALVCPVAEEPPEPLVVDPAPLVTEPFAW